ncbi:hypothetical protein CXG81DRAFT_7036, partial [Caulochytrium protostelioides]
IAGAGAGLISSVLVCPLDVCKVRLQNQSHTPGPSKYTGTMGTLRTIVREEGVRGLYRGLNATTLAYLCDRPFWFMAYYGLKPRVASWMGISEDRSVVHVAATIMASMTSTTAINPLWVIRTRIMTQTSSQRTSNAPYFYTSVWNAFKTIRADEGWRALYKGLGPSLLGISHVAVQFSLYEKLKVALAAHSERRHAAAGIKTGPHQIDNQSILLASSLSKFIATCLTYPHEVLRTRLQTQSTRTHIPYPLRKYTGILQVLKLIVKEEGFRGCYKGLATNLLRTVPASAISLWAFEFLVRAL